jgi:hypothetical protein
MQAQFRVFIFLVACLSPVSITQHIILLTIRLRFCSTHYSTNRYLIFTIFSTMAHSTNLEPFIRAAAKVVSKEWTWDDFDPTFKLLLQVSQRNMNPRFPYRRPHLPDSAYYDPLSSVDIEAREQAVCRRASKLKITSARGSLQSKSHENLKGRNDSVASQRSTERKRAIQRQNLESIVRDIYYPQGQRKDTIQR